MSKHETEKNLQALQTNLHELEDQLEALYGTSFESLSTSSSPLELAKLEATLAYVCATLYTSTRSGSQLFLINKYSCRFSKVAATGKKIHSFAK